MAGTDVELPAGEVEGFLPYVPVATICLRVATAHYERDDDGEPVLVMSDGETVVELSRGIGGDAASAARGAQRLATALLEYAAIMSAGGARDRSGGS